MYTPEQGLAIALYNTGRVPDLVEACAIAREAMSNLHAMGFDVTDFAHSAYLTTHEGNDD